MKTIALRLWVAKASSLQRVNPTLSRPAGIVALYWWSFDDDDVRSGPGGWWILLEVEVQLHPNTIVRPDLAGWQRQRLPQPWEQRPIDVIPDWICEIVSPSNAACDRVLKRQVHATAGVPYYWIVDPHERIVEASQLRDGIGIELGTWDGEAVARIAQLTAIELKLARLLVR